MTELQEDIKHYKELVTIHHKVIKQQENVRAQMGALTPPYVLLDIDERLEEVKEIIRKTIKLHNSSWYYKSSKGDGTGILINLLELLEKTFSTKDFLELRIILENLINSTFKQIEFTASAIVDDDASVILNLIAKNETGKAIELLQQTTTGNSKLFKIIILNASKYNAIQDEKRMGIITLDDYYRLLAQINYSLVDVCNILKGKL